MGCFQMSFVNTSPVKPVWGTVKQGCLNYQTVWFVDGKRNEQRL